ncbi:concanavalin A-like lectin/glucanase domain-containing protein [Chytridium lagenaria]|nr:concanavalin A-like lectin/glucanase domain-containing protein [Chytridium lagenaria]
MYVVPVGRVPAGEHYPPGLPEVDWSGYDWTIDYAPDNVEAKNHTLGLKVVKIPGGGVGSRVSTTRHILYGRFTMKLKAIGVKGMITSFITMSDRGDEIDWEIINTNPGTPATTNIFYKRILQFGLRNREHPIPGDGKSDQEHEYTIDWNSERIQWYIDDTLIRTYTRAESLYDGELEGKGERFYPSTPSMIQFGAWNGGDSTSPGLSSWAGGPVPWGDRTFFEAEFGPLNVQCYDDKNRPVPMWPVAGNRGRTEPTPQPSPTVSLAPAATISLLPGLSSGPKDAPAAGAIGNVPTASARVALGLNNPNSANGLGASTSFISWVAGTAFAVLVPLAFF